MKNLFENIVDQNTNIIVLGDMYNNKVLSFSVYRLGERRSSIIDTNNINKTEAKLSQLILGDDGGC
jgi:hypothetical protein